MKKILAIMLALVIVSIPTRVMAGQSSDSGVVASYTYDTSLRVSSSSVTATMGASFASVSFSGTASIQTTNTRSVSSIPISMSGMSYYISQTKNSPSGYSIMHATVYYYVNTLFATGLFAPA